MLERLKQIPAKLLELWKKLTKRQKIITVSTVAGVLLMLLILIILLNRVQYEKLTTFEDTETAKTAIEVLNTENITNRLADDMLTVEVDVTRKKDAVLALTGNDMLEESAMTLSMLLENDLSTTSSDKILKNHLYMQSSLGAKIQMIDGVKKASVLYFPSDNSGGILMPAREISCSVLLTLDSKEFDYKNSPEAIATYVAYAIGNTTTDKIKVLDTNGTLLFGGEEENDEIIDLSANLAYKKEVERWYNDKLFELALKNDFFDAEIVSSLDVNCDKESVLYTEYLAGEGLEQGLYDEYTKISSESTGVTGDIPGTDSNDETDYYIQESGSGNESYDELRIKYKPSERVTETMKEWGVINNANSSLGITLTRVQEISEEQLERDGLIGDEMSFEEYVMNNSAKTRLDTPEELYQLFSDASGIPANNISITTYIQPNFIAREVSESSLSLILEIVLAALIIALLLFVVFRSVKPEEVIETEPELSVERLLATTRENQSLEDIEFGEKSETRKLIEKYIDENAEAVAALLRNWLSDDGWQ